MTEPNAPERGGETAPGKCPVCGGAIAEPVVVCPRCETPHHEDCFAYNEGCAVYGCKAALVLAQRAVSERYEEVSGDVDAVPRWKLFLSDLGSIHPHVWRLLGGSLFGYGAYSLFILGSKGLIRIGRLGWMVSAVALLVGTLLAAAAPLFNVLLRDLGRLRFDPALADGPTRKELEALVAQSPKNFHLLELLAFSVYSEGDFEGARTLYKRALSVEPGSPRMHLQLGKTLRRLGQEDEALEAFGEAVRLGPDSPAAGQARWWIAMLTRLRERLTDGVPSGVASIESED